MAANIHQLIATINPSAFCEKDIVQDESGKDTPRDEDIKKRIKKGLEELKKTNPKPGIDKIARVYLDVSKKAKLKVGEWMDLEEIDYNNAMDLKGLKNAVEKHLLVYDAFGESLEPIYFWLLDLMNSFFGGKTEKLVDNFGSSVSSSFFAEMGQRQTRMQDEVMKLLGNVNTVIKSVLNIIYDLKEFKIRLDVYDDYLQTVDKEKKESALLSLKQIWLYQVDIKKGTTAIKAMAQQFDYVTLIDAFMYASSLAKIDEVDLNDRVKRLLKQRYGEFERWLVESEKELRKRFSIEKNYLKGQVASLKLYSKWIKPYLKAANDLSQNEMKSPSLVHAFNTLMLELTVMGKGKYDPADDVGVGDLPEIFKKYKGRNYYPIMTAEFRFRSSPERMTKGGYGFRGRAEVEFTSYALNDDELAILKAALDEDELGDTLRSEE